MPGPRYTLPHGVHLRGDEEVASGHLPFARKMLGYLAEQRRLNPGAPTQVLRRRMPDGTEIVAQFDGQLPKVSITTPGAQQAPEPFALQGFVLTPDGTAPDAYKETVLTRSGGWKAVFFDVAHKPAEYPGGTLIYSKVRGRSVLDAPPGLQHVGNIDWRNDKETMHVSWRGITTRYFSIDNTAHRDRFVFYKGAVLFDVLELPLADPTPPHLLSDATVAGACLRKVHGALWLLVVLRTMDDLHDNREWPGPGTRYDTVLAVPLKRPVDAPPLPSGGRIEESPRLECDYASVRYLGDQAIADDTYDYGHSWHFNQSGTQARCMRPEFYTVVRECIWTLDGDEADPLQSAVYSEVTEPWRTVSTVTVSERIYSPLRPSGTTARAEADPGDTSATTSGAELSAIAYYPGVFATDYAREFLIAETTTITKSSDGRVKCAVDFVDDVPVYAYWLPPDSVTTRSFSHDHTANFTAGLDGIDMHAGTGFLESDPATLWSIHYSGQLYESATWSRSETRTGHLGGLEFPWGSVVRAVNDSTTDTGTLSRDWTWDFTSTTIETAGDDNPKVPPWSTDAAGAINGGQGDRSYSVSRTQAQSLLQDGFDLSFYADLRYGWHVYIREVQGSTSNTATAGSRSYAFNPSSTPVAANPALYAPGATFGVYSGVTAYRNGDGGGGEPPTGTVAKVPGAVSATSTSQHSRHYVVTLNGLLVHSEPLSSSSSSGGPVVSDFTCNDQPGWIARFGINFNVEFITVPGRTETDYIALAPDAQTPVSDGSTATIEADYMYEGYINDGSWQTYRGYYCFASPACESEQPPVAYLQGVGKVAGPVPDPDAPGVLIGYPTSDVLWPVSILPPTKPF